MNHKNILLGVTGGIAAYKIPNLASMLRKNGYDIEVILTENATNFITPLTFETLTGNRCITSAFDRNHKFSVEHIGLAKKTDLVMIAPCTANVIGKLANGIADDMLTTTVMACKCPIYIVPAMNTNMYENPIVKDNIRKLKSFGFNIIEAASGYLACGDCGKGKMPEPDKLFSYIKKELAFPVKDFTGKKVLVTAGATQESIDPVRYITNHSSGKMGYALAETAMLRGADVTLISGVSALPEIPFVKNVKVVSAEDMFSAVKEYAPTSDIIIKAAAVADYTPVSFSENKIKKSDSDMSIPLKRTQDILAYLGQHKKDNQFICGFSMETCNLIENSSLKLVSKNADMICANSLNSKGSGFKTDTNDVTIITKDGSENLGLLSKYDTAVKILDKIISIAGNA